MSSKNPLLQTNPTAENLKESPIVGQGGHKKQSTISNDRSKPQSHSFNVTTHSSHFATNSHPSIGENKRLDNNEPDDEAHSDINKIKRPS
jgi:hypothetical protein